MINSPAHRTLFIVKKRVSMSYGEPFGLLYSARFVAHMLRMHHVDASVSVAIDGNDVDRLVTDANPKNVVLEALWVTPDKLRELMSLERHKDRNWIVRIHSKPTFLAMEGIAMKWLGEMVDMTEEFPQLTLSANNRITSDELSAVYGLRFKFLPNFYINHNIRAESPTRNSNVVKIGCFGAQRPLKNTLEQAIAAIIYANRVDKKLKFYINTDRVEQHGEPVLKNVRELFKSQDIHELVEVTWKSHSEFIELVSTMDLGMQVSLSESFNIVTADFVSVGVPVVVSDEISWMPCLFKAPTTDAMKIADKLDDLYITPRLITRLLARRGLKHYNDKSQRIWLHFIRS